MKLISVHPFLRDNDVWSSLLDKVDRDMTFDMTVQIQNEIYTCCYFIKENLYAAISKIK